MECGCHVVHSQYDECETEYCPLHEAAPKMYRALMIAVGVFAALDTKTSNEVADICRQALVEGGK